MIPGQVISLISFMGIVVHEWAHKMACHLLGIRVISVKYFSLSGGYVRHEKVTQPRASICIALAPLVVNTLVALFMGCILAAMTYWDMHVGWVHALIIYIGVTVGMHAFPSRQDMNNFVELTAELRRRNLNILARIMGGFFSVLRALSFFWVDIWIAMLVMMVPTFVLRHSVPEYRARRDMQENVRTTMDNCAELKNIVRDKFTDTDFEIVMLYDIDRASGQETETKSPYGQPFVAFRDKNDNDYFFVFTMDVPGRDCKYMMTQKWDDVDDILSPDDCADTENGIMVRYHI
ncbi:MAG: DUF3267 domain-containing protein [Alphaproteobacteria bacterium]|nr:DUF3267 domain-containing protein [Alphaproteobacteria bacterium]